MPDPVNEGDAAAAGVNRWAWWQAALKGNFGPIHDGDPQQGYYRVRTKDKQTGKKGPWEPVAIWVDEETGEWLAYRNGREANAVDIWTWVCREPITYEAYNKAIGGEGWDDDAPVRETTDPENADPHKQLLASLEKDRKQAETLIKTGVKTKADADKIAGWSKRLAGLKKDAEARRVVEKQPFLDGGRVVDAKWKEITDAADGLVKQLKKALEPYLKEQKREEEARAQKAAQEAEALRQEAVRLNDEDSRAAALQAADRAEAEAKVEKKSAGSTGSKVSLRVEKIGKVDDYAKAAQALVEMKHPDMIALIDQLANRAARSGMPFAGMTIVENEKAV
jgi:hypothetical protein